MGIRLNSEAVPATVNLNLKKVVVNNFNHCSFLEWEGSKQYVSQETCQYLQCSSNFREKKFGTAKILLYSFVFFLIILLIN